MAITSATTMDDRRRKATAIGASVATLGTILGLTAPFVFSRSRLPYMATPGRKLHHALQFIRSRHYSTLSSETKTSCRFVDLGSGDGEGVYQAAKLGYQAFGVELNYTLYWISQFRRFFFWTRQERRLSQFKCQNLFQTQIVTPSSASNTTTTTTTDSTTIVVVMIYGINPIMESLSAKLSKELQPSSKNNNHAYVMSYRFLLPVNQQHSNQLQADVIYNHEDMRIYQVRTTTTTTTTGTRII